MLCCLRHAKTFPLHKGRCDAIQALGRKSQMVKDSPELLQPYKPAAEEGHHVLLELCMHVALEALQQAEQP